MGPPCWGCDLIAASSRATEGGPDYSRVMGISLQREILLCFAVSRRATISNRRSQISKEEPRVQSTKDKAQSTKLALALHALQQLVQYFNVSVVRFQFTILTQCTRR